jgi:UDP-N-acetylglucosamine 3-dehydrogenase
VVIEIDLRDQKIPIAVAGLGAIGRQHARLLSESARFQIVAVCDANPTVRDEFAELLQVPAVEHFEQLLEFQPIAVVNALPTHLHYESTRVFLENGLHVLVEKPIASSVEEANELAKMAEDVDRVLLVGQVERFNAGVVALKEQIESGRLGEIISVVSRRVGTARPAVPHANVALDLAIHDVDAIRFMLGTPGELITSFGSSIGENRLEDHVDLVLRYGETFCTVQANWITPVKIRRLSVTGTKATAELDYITQQLAIFEMVPEVIKGNPWDFFAVSQQSDAVEIPVTKSEPLRAELDHFARCIAEGEAPMVTAKEATDALALVAAATDLMQVSA